MYDCNAEDSTTSVEVIAAGMTNLVRVQFGKFASLSCGHFSEMSNIEYREDEGSEVSFKPTRCDLYQISLIPIPAQA